MPLRSLLLARCVTSLSLFGALLAACPAKPPVVKTVPAADAAAPASAPATGRIVLDCQPPDARVMVDGALRGTAGELQRQGGLQLPRGLHRLEIARPGYRPYRLELNLGERTETIRVQLRTAAGQP